MNIEQINFENIIDSPEKNETKEINEKAKKILEKFKGSEKYEQVLKEYQDVYKVMIESINIDKKITKEELEKIKKELNNMEKINDLLYNSENIRSELHTKLNDIFFDKNITFDDSFIKSYIMVPQKSIKLLEENGFTNEQIIEIENDIKKYNDLRSYTYILETVKKGNNINPSKNIDLNKNIDEEINNILKKGNYDLNTIYDEYLKSPDKLKDKLIKENKISQDEIYNIFTYHLPRKKILTQATYQALGNLGYKEEDITKILNSKNEADPKIENQKNKIDNVDNVNNRTTKEIIRPNTTFFPTGESLNYISATNITLQTISGEIKINFTEYEIVKNNHEALKNLVDFRQTLKDLNIEKLWTYRGKIFNVLSNKPGTNFNNRDNYIGKDELRIFLVSILRSVLENPINIDNLEELKGEFKQINKVDPISGKKDVTNSGSSYVENIFIKSYIENGYFKEDMFSKII